MEERNLKITTRETAGVKNRLYGKYRGVVEYNLDPLRVGRCKVRVPSLHSTEVSLDIPELPWAWPLHPFGGFHDGGSFIVPPVGATVFVEFEMGDPEHPIYFGSWYKNPTESREINYKTSAKTGEVSPTHPVTSGQWQQPIGPEAPSEALGTPYHDPTVRIVHKSLKGATFIIEDRDGFEYTKVIDRAGQELVLSSPVKFLPNDNNSAPRGAKEAALGTELGYDLLEAQTASIELVGVNGQGLKIVATPDAESVEILSRNPVTDDQENSIKVRIAAGMGTFEVSGVAADENTVTLHVDTKTGEVKIKTTSIHLEGEYITLSGPVTTTSDVTIGGDLVVSGSVL